MGKFDGSSDLTILNSQSILLGTGLHFNDGKITVNDSHLTNHIQNIFSDLYIVEYFKNYDLLNLKLKNKDLEKIEKICENLSKNDFTIPKKYKYKKNIAKYLRKIYGEYKWLRTYHFKFLITENFKNLKK